MNFSFLRRGRNVSLEVVENAVALSITQGGATGSRHLAATELGGDQEVFEHSGWIFRPLGAGRASSQEAARMWSGPGRQVFRTAEGNLRIATDRLFIQFEPGIERQDTFQRLRRVGLRLVHEFGFAPNAFEIRVPGDRSVPEVLQQLQSKPAEFPIVEPLLLESLVGRGAPPRVGTGRNAKSPGQGYDLQWQHRNRNRVGADIHSEAAWFVTRGAGKRIAVIDNGMQVGHPNLRSGVAGGGYFRQGLSGSTRFRSLPKSAARFPSGDHGTFCLGMAGARSEGIGIRGSAPEAELISIACLPDQIGTQATLARAVAYAANPALEGGDIGGADVISCSLGPSSGADWGMTTVLEEAITYAATRGRSGRGTPVFWAVSNGPHEIVRDEVASHPHVIAVGRSNSQDRADGSASGPRLAFLAPGADVYCTYASSRYGHGTGTSYATPLAAGVAALVLSVHPDWTAEQVRERLCASCDQVGGVSYDRTGHHVEYGHGRLNAERAVS